MIRKAIEEYLLDRPDYKGSTKLWASDLGNCPRRAILRITGTKGDSFEVDALEYMNFGIIYEDDTINALKHQWPGRIVRDQMRLEDSYWSGKADAVLEFSGETVIVEHKAVGNKWWNYKGSLPKLEHVAQLYLYGYLYEKKTGRKPQLVLYYRAWGNWAELNINVFAEKIHIAGLENGKPYKKIIEANVDEWRQELEMWFNKRHEELPPRLSNKNEGCTFRGQPSCQYYRHCWGE